MPLGVGPPVAGPPGLITPNGELTQAPVGTTDDYYRLRGYPYWVRAGTAKLTVNAAALQTVLPIGRADGNLLILDFTFAGPDTATQNTDLVALGWTQDAQSPVKAAFGQFWRYYRPVDGGETAPNLTFSVSNDAQAIISLVAESGGVDTSSKAADTGTTNFTINTASLTTAMDNEVLFTGFALRSAATPYGQLSSDPDYTERAELDSGQASGSGMNMSISDRGPVLQGTYSGDVFTVNNTVTGRLMIITTAIKPILLPDLSMAPLVGY